MGILFLSFKKYSFRIKYDILKITTSFRLKYDILKIATSLRLRIWYFENYNYLDTELGWYKLQMKGCDKVWKLLKFYFIIFFFTIHLFSYNKISRCVFYLYLKTINMTVSTFWWRNCGNCFIFKWFLFQSRHF